MPAPTDRFALPDATPRASKTTINIAGILVYLYGVDELTPQQAQDTTVLFHVHGRTRSYKDAEAIAHELLYEIKSKGQTKKGLVVATFDNRNHGTRTIDNVAINDWKGGNVHHAQDMLSTIDGNVADLQLVMDYLASYTTGRFVPTQFVATGLSLGGHTTWNMLARDARIQHAIAIIGSPDLTSMFLERLAAQKGYPDTTKIPADAKEWPATVDAISRKRDASLSEIRGKHILILNGKDDPLVPSKFTHPWLDQYGANNTVTFVEQPGCGHMLSWAMMEKMVAWLHPVLAE